MLEVVLGSDDITVRPLNVPCAHPKRHQALFQHKNATSRGDLNQFVRTGKVRYTLMGACQVHTERRRTIVTDDR